MRFKCINKYYIEDTLIMVPGDIIVMNDNNLYNVTTGVDYKNISDMDRIKSNLEAITDESDVNFAGGVIPAHPFENITEKMFSTYKRKNKDYGDSFDKTLDEWGLPISAVRLEDKLNRYKSFVKNGTFHVRDEGVRDTLMDLATYAIMTIMYLDKHGNV